jgi:DNA modification methylase
MKVPISKVKPNPDNPRIIKDDKFKKLVQSLKDFPEMTEVRPIVVNKEMMILGGNMRLKAMQEARWKEVPVTVVDWPEEKQKEFIIKDNSNFGDWDWDTLANEWDEIKLEEWGLDLPELKIDEVKEDDYEIPDEIETDIVKGDLFEIGEHRLLCGDSTLSQDVSCLMNSEKWDLIFTDPPYGVNYQKTNASKSSRSRSRSEITGDNLKVNEISEEIWSPAFKNLYDFAKDDCSFYMTMCQGGDQMMMMMMMMSQHWQVKHELIWVKSAPVFSMGRLDYDYKHEPIIFGWKKKHNFYGKGEFTKSVWEIPKPSKSENHPTMKPVQLVGNAINNSSKTGDCIGDLFLGSGTTMVASHQLNRKCYGIEIDPKYCQIILERMLKLDPSLELRKNGELWETTNKQPSFAKSG